MFRNRTVILVSFLTTATGFLAGFWPLAVFGVLLATVSGHWVTAILLGFLLDLAYGAPGWLHYIYFPLTALAVVGSVLRVVIVGKLRKRGGDTL